jgi:hypothetical protein
MVRFEPGSGLTALPPHAEEQTEGSRTRHGKEQPFASGGANGQRRDHRGGIQTESVELRLRQVP